MPPRFVAPGAGVLAIGSVIKFARANTKVWGSGSPRLTDRLSPDATYCAVRGPLTRRLVRDSGGTCPEIYGDPALLLPRLYHPRVTKRHALGLIRHHVHGEEPLSLAPDVAEIDILRCGAEEIEAFLDEVLACEIIISTSLHGLIVAHAYGIPAVWADFSGATTRIQGNHVKFLDYFASVGITDVAPFDLSGIELLSAGLVRRHARVMQAPPDLDKLLDTAPFDVRTDEGAPPVRPAAAALVPSLS
nr:polysaccharide pyruvyl transferase family protein [Neoroseomonas terrae]